MTTALPIKMLTPSEVAEILDVAPRTVENWIAEELLAVVRVGHVRRIAPEALAEFITAHTFAARTQRGAACRLAEADVELLWGRMQRLIETQSKWVREAEHALKSYAFGNGSPDLAAEILEAKPK